MIKRALVLHQEGRLDEAETAYLAILSGHPDHADALHLLGVLQHQQGRSEEAAGQIEKACELRPQEPQYFGNLGLVLHTLGRFDDAEHACQQALALAPDFVPGHINLGNVYNTQERYPEAVDAFRRAIEIDPRTPEAHFNLANTFRLMGDSANAIAVYRDTVKLAPEAVDVHYNLANVLASTGDIDGAFASYLRARTLDPEHADIRAALVHLLAAHDVNAPDQMLAPVLTALLSDNCVDPRRLSRAAINHLRRTHEFISDNEPCVRCHAVFRDPLCLTLLSCTPNVDLELEALIVDARHWALFALDGDALDFASTIETVTAIALQCFLNEYLYAESQAETARIDELVTCFEQREFPVGAQAQPRFCFELSVLASYRPLAALPVARRLLKMVADDWPMAIRHLVQRTIVEPFEENCLRVTLGGGLIENRVSLAVKAQYEESPYPRWQYVLQVRSEPIGMRLARSYRSFNANAFPSGKARILIAGCGTGQQAIETALQCAGATVEGVDLSLASLAVALRKTREMSIDNLQLRIADILNLDDGAGYYHVIECVGVLHHMDNPETGLTCLARRLAPGGVLKLGLYSQIARRTLERARTQIREQRIAAEPNAMRGYRRKLIDEDSDLLTDLSGWTDFFTLSEFRDLVFHVHEHEYTLPEVGTMLRNTELRFLGFEFTTDNVLTRYRKLYPDDPGGTDLSCWAAFEKRFPDTFRGMYQFWVQSATT